MKNKSSDSLEENDEFLNESESGDEDWESYDEEYDEENGESAGEDLPVKKSNFNNIVMGIAVIVALAVGGFTVFGGKKPSPAPSAQPSPLADNNTPGVPLETAQPLPDTAALERPLNPVENAVPPPPPATSEELSAEEAPVESSQQESDDLPMPSVITQKTDEEPLTPMPDAQPATDEVEPDQGALTLSTSPSLDDAANPSLASQSEAPPEAPAAATSTQASAEIAAQLDDLAKKIDAIESGVAEGLSQINDLKSSVGDLERRIAAIETAPPSRKEEAPRISGNLSPAAKSAPVSDSGDSVSVTSQPSISHSWVLKSAQPGQAMVARKEGGDIFTIKVGDRLPGIGRITSISLISGRWVVKGESADITQ